MKILMINGTMRKGSTYNIAHLLINNLVQENDTVEELFLPQAMPHFCVGCASCVMKGEENCPHFEYVDKIRQSIDEADILIFTSPVFVMHTTGQMKALLDHFAYRWMVHRPEEKMFTKQAVVISTAAGAGTKSTNKDILDSLNFWGVGKTYSYGKAVAATSWDHVSSKKVSVITKDMKKLAEKIKSKAGRVGPSLKVRVIFGFIRLMHKKVELNKIDNDYWKNKGWINNQRPWKTH